mgnify:CR=1 FL=1
MSTEHLSEYTKKEIRVGHAHPQLDARPGGQSSFLISATTASRKSGRSRA